MESPTPVTPPPEVGVLLSALLAGQVCLISDRLYGEVALWLRRAHHRLEPMREGALYYRAVSEPKTLSFSVQMPASDLALGRWMEKHGAELSVQCALGTFHVKVGTKRLLSYSDGDQHAEIREFSGHHADPSQAISLAFERAFAALGRP